MSPLIYSRARIHFYLDRPKNPKSAISFMTYTGIDFDFKSSCQVHVVPNADETQRLLYSNNLIY